MFIQPPKEEFDNSIIWKLCLHVLNYTGIQFYDSVHEMYILFSIKKLEPALFIYKLNTTLHGFDAKAIDRLTQCLVT